MENRRVMTMQILGVLFGLVFILVYWQVEPVISLDKSISQVVNQSVGSWSMIEAMNWISNYTIGSLAGVVIIIFYLLNKERLREVGYLGISSLILLVVNVLLKNIVMRLRPFERMSSITNYSRTNILDYYSFPSSHATFAFFIAYFLVNTVWKDNKYRNLIYVLATLVAFSRVYLGVHYLSDVIAGSLIGLIFGMAVVGIGFEKENEPK